MSAQPAGARCTVCRLSPGLFSGEGPLSTMATRHCLRIWAWLRSPSQQAYYFSRLTSIKGKYIGNVVRPPILEVPKHSKDRTSSHSALLSFSLFSLWMCSICQGGAVYSQHVLGCRGKDGIYRRWHLALGIRGSRDSWGPLGSDCPSSQPTSDVHRHLPKHTVQGPGTERRPSQFNILKSFYQDNFQVLKLNINWIKISSGLFQF